MLGNKNWDDLRLVLAIAEGKGLSGAAKLLGVHHATVLRRLNTLEHINGVVLFDRLPGGYAPTEVGEELSRIARSLSEDVDAAYRKLAGEDLRMSGTLRIATSDFLSVTLLPRVLEVFAERYPEVEIQSVVSAQHASLGKREADVAMRAVRSVPKPLIGTQLATLGYGAYAHKKLIGEGFRFEKISQLDWIGDDQTIMHVASSNWRQTHYPDVTIRLRADSMLGKLMAVKSGLGVGFLPHYIARTEANLNCLHAIPDEWSLDLWLLCHPDLYRLRRVSAFVHVAQEVIQAYNLSEIDENSVLTESQLSLQL